jgi:hypothetical protein
LSSNWDDQGYGPEIGSKAKKGGRIWILMLCNMASMKEIREKLQTLCINQTKILQYEKSWMQMTIAKSIYMLTN